nr:PepSY domain-containing protein [Aliidiomarina haloalkalitolerans]
MRKKSWNVRKVHRWLTLLFGIQLIIWAITGSFMVLMQLHYIHGDHLVQEADKPISEAALVELNVSQRFQDVVQAMPGATNVILVNRLVAGEFRYVFQVTANESKSLLTADGLEIVELTEGDILALAQRYYRPIQSRQAQVDRVEFLSESGPSELHPRHLPVWRVDFLDRRNTSLYLSAQTGELVTKRHRAWRWFDLAWMLHIMDYQERENISTPWILFFTITTFFIAITGSYLLLRHFSTRWWRQLWRK